VGRVYGRALQGLAMSYKIWDCETTTRTSFKRKANPFDKLNWVVTHAFAGPDGKVQEHRFGRDRPPAGWLVPVLQNARLIIGFNIKFDLLHALQDETNLSAWMDFVAGGGNVWDCQLAEYLLEGMVQDSHMLSLDEVAPRYGGDIKFDEVKTLWAAGVATEDIEPELLTRYLCGDGKDIGDIGNTHAVFTGQIRRARDVGQLNSIVLNMGSLLYTIEAERNGMFIDTELGKVLTKELEVTVAELKLVLNAYIPKDLPFEFKWTSRHHKSALIFGGVVKYDSYEYDLEDGSQVDIKDFNADPDKYSRVFSKKEEVQVLLANGVPVVYSSGKNKGEVKTKKVKVDDLTKPKGRKSRAQYPFPRITAPEKTWVTSETGVWSTAGEVIEALGVRDIPFLKALAEFSTASKDLGTYFMVTDEDGNSKGMLSLVDGEGIIHHKINHTSTVTGRFSSSDPNLQNIPKGNKSKVKQVFVSRFKDGSIVQSDFSSLEIYVQAILTKCHQLIEDLKLGLDMHCLRLANTEGLPYEEVLLKCKGNDSTPADKEWGYKRTDSKVYSFQAAYGAGDKKIASTTGMDEERVAALRAADDLRYPEIKRYFEQRTEEIKANRRPSGITIPHPEIPGVMCSLGKSFVRTPDNKLYMYKEQPSPEYLVKRGMTSSFSPTEIKNYEVQGEGGEWAKAAMWLVVREFYRNKNFGGRALLVNQVHDAVYADSAPEVLTESAATLHACMEAASEYMEYLFKWDIPVPVPSETKAGSSMAEEASIPGLKELAANIRLDIRQRYMKGYCPSFER
jgi:DNA polymerase I